MTKCRANGSRRERTRPGISHHERHALLSTQAERRKAAEASLPALHRADRREVRAGDADERQQALPTKCPGRSAFRILARRVACGYKVATQAPGDLPTRGRRLAQKPMP